MITISFEPLDGSKKLVMADFRRKGQIMYVYINSEPGLWTVGFYRPDGKWEPESDHTDREDAASRVAWLNGNQS